MDELKKDKWKVRSIMALASLSGMLVLTFFAVTIPLMFDGNTVKSVTDMSGIIKTLIGFFSLICATYMGAATTYDVKANK